MKILVVGGGGREHALVWKLSQGPGVEKVYAAPGNAGTAGDGENVDIAAEDITGLLDFALAEKIDLTVVGPELPLTLGIVDEFRSKGLKVFGPDKSAAILEGSKVFTKELLHKNNIPTAFYKTFEDPDAAKAYVETHEPPFVVKADGLASGKGVLICHSKMEALDAITTVMEKKAFGKAGDKLIIEEFLEGEEASFIAVTDGKTVVPFPSSQDHKAVYEGDRGPNTGGMGAYSPAPVVTPELEKEIMETIMVPTVKAMEKEGRPYQGVLYAGLMIKEGRPKVLEFNCRFGDPEAQPLLMRMDGDLAGFLLAAAEQRLDGVELKWNPKAAVCVVMASRGYPGPYEKGKSIEGLDDVAGMPEVKVFHAGTKSSEQGVVTSGGRVLGVTALGASIGDAIDRAYKAVDGITWDGAYYRKDIGKKALGERV